MVQFGEFRRDSHPYRRQLLPRIHRAYGEIQLFYSALLRRILLKVARRLIPVLFICYVAAYLDRVNVGFADLQRLNSNEVSKLSSNGDFWYCCKIVLPLFRVVDKRFWAIATSLAHCRLGAVS